MKANTQLVYIVDDDEIYTFGIKKLLAIRGLAENVVVFMNGEEALHGLMLGMKNGNIPDVILLDINMPVMDGWGFLEAFSKIRMRKHPRLYIVSSSIDPNDLEKARSITYIEEYLVKPIKPDTLAEILS